MLIRHVAEAATRRLLLESGDVDMAKNLSPDQVAAIEAGMDRFAVLVYRGQHLTDEEQLAFTLHFGEIEGKGRGRGSGR